MITLQVETVDECLVDIQPLIEDHWQEIGIHKDKMKLNPDYNAYYSLEKLGMLHIVTARESDELVGYFISIVQPHIHYKSNIQAMNDILFVDKRFRGRSLGIKLFLFAEKELKKIGVSFISIHSKTQQDLKPLVERLGYTHSENVYTKWIGV